MEGVDEQLFVNGVVNQVVSQIENDFENIKILFEFGFVFLEDVYERDQFDLECFKCQLQILKNH